MNKPLVATLAFGLLASSLAGCGHSEEEWQAQLGRYRAELTRADARQKEIADLRTQVTEARNKVTDLEQQLTSMGVNIDPTDPNPDAMSDNVEVVRRALDAAKARARILEVVKARMVAMRGKLEELGKIGVKVTIRKNRIVINLPADVLFEPGKTDLKPDGKAMLLKVAETIRNDPSLLSRDFQAAAHTDNKPTAGPPYFDNLGLTLMRARQVVLFLTAPTAPIAKRGERLPDPGAGLSPMRWSATGHGDTDPIAPNDSPEGMRRNRRIELVIAPGAEEMIDLRSLSEPSSSVAAP